jgi:hypothetical protein
MFKNVASQKLTVFAFDSTTNLPKTGDAANITAYVSIDGGTVTALGDTSATELDSTNAKGYYSVDVSQSETNGDKLLFSAKSSTSNIVVVAVPAVVYTVPPNFSAQAIDASGRVDVGKVAGTAQTARDLGANLDAAVSTRLATSGYTAPDNAGIGAIKAKTDNLPADPASNTQVSTRAAPGDAMALTSGERTTLVAGIFAFVTEGAETFLAAVRLMRAALVGKSSGFPGSPATFRDQADTKARITVTHVADGNRTALTTDAT